MKKNLKNNLRSLFAVAFCIILFGFLNSESPDIGIGIGTFLGALALAVFDVWVLKSDNNTESISKEKVWDFFLYLSLFIIATVIGVNLINLEPFYLLLGVFFGFILYNAFRPRNPDPISLLRKEIWRRVFPSKN